MLATAFALAIWLTVRRAEARGIGGKFAADLSILVIVVALIGARATYVFTHFEEFVDHPLDAISPFQSSGRIGISGLVLVGGVIAGFLTAWYYSRRRHRPFLAVTDLLAPSVALGIAIGRIGCFLNGCCFGLPTGLPWGCRFPDGSYAGYVFPNAHIHPTQLYAVLYMLIIFAVLLIIDRKPRAMGIMSGWFLTFYGVARFINEGFRWYEPGMILFQSGGFRFTFSRAVSVFMFVLGVYLLLSRRKEKTYLPET